MKKFIKKLLLFTIITSALMSLIAIFDVFVVGGQYKFNYQASAIDKVSRLKEIGESKIILVGHSNLSFGIDSKMIEQELSMPVVNMGLHGGLGNAFHEELVKPYINKGDIVVICHSDFADNDEIIDPSLAWITYDLNSELKYVFREKDFKNMLFAYPNYLKSSLFLWITNSGNLDLGGSYSRSSFNEYGDIVIKPKEGGITTYEYFLTNEVKVPEINTTCTNRLNQLNEYIEGRGATMVVAGYPIAFGKYSDFNENDFKVFQSKLEEELDCKVISNYIDYFLTYDLFYDTILHLNEKGTEIRTLQLIKDLKQYIN